MQHVAQFEYSNSTVCPRKTKFSIAMMVSGTPLEVNERGFAGGCTNKELCVWSLAWGLYWEKMKLYQL